MRWFKHGVRFVLVTVGIIALTSFTIDATDALNGSQSALSILARNATEGGCDKGMVKVELADRSYCIDQFENSLGDECTAQVPSSASDSQTNVDAGECTSETKAEEKPWTFISYHQAKLACVNRGGRLPSPGEWYEAALGTPGIDGCNLEGSLSETGNFPTCQSSRGVFDMVGNVWEWVDTTIESGSFAGRELPDEGFVTEADSAGVAVITGSDGSELFGQDYFWSNGEGTQAMMRGGFYGSGEDGGVYAVHTKVTPSFSSGAIGFRCVMDL